MTDFDEQQESPLFEAKRFDEPSVFTPDSLLSEAQTYSPVGAVGARRRSHRRTHGWRSVRASRYGR
ncbi:MAG: hypothetical protein ABEJ94_04545 [Halorientalis sp.]